jgi:2-oxoglutarate dehydrogenase E1 component
MNEVPFFSFPMNLSVSARLNADLLDENYAKWKSDPSSVDTTWSAFFEGFELGMEQLKKKGEPQSADSSDSNLRVTQTDASFRSRVVSLVYLYRTLGHTQAWIDPLSKAPPINDRLSYEEFGFESSDLQQEVASQFYSSGEPMKLSQMIGRLNEDYCGYVGYEFMHIHENEIRNWIRDRIEVRENAWNAEHETKEQVLRWLLEAELFEKFLHQKYVAQKRFGLEGGESVMVALNGLLQQAPSLGIKEFIVGMAHRGRLNVLANFLQKPLTELFHEFSENYVPDLVAGDGDVKYHLGFESEQTTDSGDKVKIILAANPSHLEAVNAVVEGMARARQRANDDTENREQVVPILLHGDAAFAGQGSVAEVLNFSQLPGYRTGGTIHLIINNQIGFTTMPADARSSVYCTDVAKMIEAPVFHVNGDCPLDVLNTVRLAMEFRQKFHRDVIIDIVCYRRHGHNEADEPAFTQPQTYKAIATKKSTATIYKERLVDEDDMTSDEVAAVENSILERLESDYLSVKTLVEKGEMSFHHDEDEPKPTPQVEYNYDRAKTAITLETLKDLGQKLVHIPADFQINGKLQRMFLTKREQATANGGPYDWAHAEALAFGSLLVEKIPVRLSGQDCRRGTFSQRHAVFYDTETRERHVPLRHLSDDQANFCAYNSLLSEAGVLGFDYGYTLMVPQMLILWEAQFGDFANGAQVIIDQFISSAESKWQSRSSLVMLLPHGYEGQGPEHSSARLERFLQLCAGGNMQVCNITKPAQYFHVLRRQVVRDYRKPLIIMTPKSLLRHEKAVSHDADFIGDTNFQEMLDDDQLTVNPDKVTRLIFCTGKVYYDLLKYREEQNTHNVAIIRIEQLYPFHWDMLKAITSRYPHAAKKWVWCQEEPLNMGAWSYVGPRLQKFGKHKVRYAGRERSSSPAAGSKAVHNAEQRKLVANAFNV